MLALEYEQGIIRKHHQKLPAPTQTVWRNFKKMYRLLHSLVHCRWYRSFPKFVLIWKWNDYGMNLTSLGLKWLLQRLAGKECFLVLLAPKNVIRQRRIKNQCIILCFMRRIYSSILQYLRKKDLNEHRHEKN